MPLNWTEFLPWQEIIQAAQRLGVFAVGAAAVTFLLNRWAHREQVRFSTLHTERAEALGESYRLLAQAEQALEWASDVQPGDGEAARRLGEFDRAANSFREYALQHRIWLPTEVCDRLDDYWTALKAAGYTVHDWRKEKPHVTYDDVVAVSRTALPAARRELEAHVRRLLGDA